MTLVLEGNSIITIRNRAFYSLKYLTKLDLSSNKISLIQPGAFDGLENLQRIYLHANRLETMNANQLPPSLHGITLHDNRWARGFVELWDGDLRNGPVWNSCVASLIDSANLFT